MGIGILTSTSMILSEVVLAVAVFLFMMYNMKERFGIKANLISVDLVELQDNDWIYIKN